MEIGGLVPFVRLFPQQAPAETRVLTTFSCDGLPDDTYGLLESYCTDPSCDCRRVMLHVAARHQGTILAAISYGFDRDAPHAGPFLDPLNPQSAYAGTLLELVQEVLADPAYTARLEAHYAQVKRSVWTSASPHPQWDVVGGEGRAARRARARAGRRVH
jgi:hypothetical protein